MPIRQDMEHFCNTNLLYDIEVVYVVVSLRNALHSRD